MKKIGISDIFRAMEEQRGFIDDKGRYISYTYADFKRVMLEGDISTYERTIKFWWNSFHEMRYLRKLNQSDAYVFHDSVLIKFLPDIYHKKEESA